MPDTRTTRHRISQNPAASACTTLEYWTGGEYLGLGVAAHSYTVDEFTQRHSNVCGISEYLLAVADGTRPIADSMRLATEVIGANHEDGVVEFLERDWNDAGRGARN